MDKIPTMYYDIGLHQMLAPGMLLIYRYYTIPRPTCVYQHGLLLQQNEDANEFACTKTTSRFLPMDLPGVYLYSLYNYTKISSPPVVRQCFDNSMLPLHHKE